MAPQVPSTTDVFTGKIPSLNVNYPSRGYVTFLAGNGDYVKGVIGLAKGLRKVKSAYPLVVAILPDVLEEHREMLKSQGCIVKEILPIHPPDLLDTPDGYLYAVMDCFCEKTLSHSPQYL